MKSESARRWQPHLPFWVYVYVLFWTGLRPSEASGLQWRDVDLDGARLHVQRSRHLYDDGAPKTESADRWVELFPATVRLLRLIQRLHVTPESYVFATTTGTPIEPKAFATQWYACLRALGIRQRGLYCTKDTFVTSALRVGARIAWLEAQTGVNYATLRQHYGKWMGDGDESDLRRFGELDATLFGPVPARIVSATDTISQASEKSVVRTGPWQCEEGDLNPRNATENKGIST
jgi:integrase